MFQSRTTRATGDPEADSEVPPLDQDKLYVFQLSLSSPLLLSPHSCYYAGIVTRQKHSERIYTALQSASILAADGTLSTAHIRPDFTHHLAFISKFAQRRLVGVLFFWEEEVQRLRQILDSEQEIMDLLSSAAVDDDVRCAIEIELRKLKARKAIRPSARRHGEPEVNIDEAMIRREQQQRAQSTSTEDPPPYSQF